MASFQIHHDISDKENPKHGKALREKSSSTAQHALTTKQPLSVIGGAGVVSLKEKSHAVAAGPRANFAMLNTNVQRGNGAVAAAAAGSKVAFRDVGNTNKVKDENSIGGGVATVAAIKKSNVVPVVEQFKTFSVYEDNNSSINIGIQQQQNVARANTAATGAATVLDKENLIVTQQQRTHFDVKYESMHRDVIEYDLDGTPMSVTDVLSPMSVDRSQLSTSLVDNTSLIDISDSTERQLTRKELVPRNDRQRFFEVVEYQRCILEYFRESEKKHRPKPQYMRRQTDINYSMRTILVDWLVEVSEEYNLDTETLYLAVSYIDRFLSQMSVVRSKLQLVGTAAMYIASKYEEIYPPDVGEFVFITDDTYTKAQVLRMEQIILKILAFDLCTPTAYVFLNTYAVLCDIPDQLKNLALYISELSLLDADPYLRFLPSLISAASLALARHILGYELWSPELQDITTYSLNDLKEVILHLCKTHNAATTLAQQATKDKYSKDKYKNVSGIEPVELTESDFDELAVAYELSNAARQQQQKALEQQNPTTTVAANAPPSAAKVNLFFKF